MALHACSEAREQLVEPVSVSVSVSASASVRVRVRLLAALAGLCPRLPRTAASLGQSAAWAALAGHTGLAFDRARRASVPYSAWRPGSKLPCASGMHSTQEAGTRSLCVQYGGPIMDVRVSTSGDLAIVSVLSSACGGRWPSPVMFVPRTGAANPLVGKSCTRSWWTSGAAGATLALALPLPRHRAAVGQSRSLPNQAGGIA